MWLYEDSIKYAQCPKCKAFRGKKCRSSDGDEVWKPHVERVEYFERFGKDHGPYLKKSSNKKTTKIGRFRV